MTINEILEKAECITRAEIGQILENNDIYILIMKRKFIGSRPIFVSKKDRTVRFMDYKHDDFILAKGSNIIWESKDEHTNNIAERC